MSFSVPGYRRLWAGAVLFALGQWMERVAVGWFVLDTTGSVFLTAASFAARSAPSIILGPVAGAISDRARRSRVLALTAAGTAAVFLVMAALVYLDGFSVGALLVLVALSGCGMIFSTANLHALAGDIVGPARLSNAIALTSTGQRAVAAVGSIGGGVFIEVLGPGPTFILAAIPVAAAAVIYAGIPAPARSIARSGASLLTDTVEGLRTVVRIPMVALLLGMMVLVEILGFSYQSLLPVVAERVLEVDATGLGGLVAASSAGSMLGTIALTLLSDLKRQGVLLVGVFGAFGLGLIALGLSGWYLVSLLAVCCVGAAAAMVDALEWILLQKHVPDELRGRVLGAWGVAIGFGWVGPIVLGAVAARAGAPWALACAGLVLVSAAAIIGVRARSLRSA